MLHVGHSADMVAAPPFEVVQEHLHRREVAWKVGHTACGLASPWAHAYILPDAGLHNHHHTVMRTVKISSKLAAHTMQVDQIPETSLEIASMQAQHYADLRDDLICREVTCKVGMLPGGGML